METLRLFTIYTLMCASGIILIYIGIRMLMDTSNFTEKMAKRNSFAEKKIPFFTNKSFTGLHKIWGLTGLLMGLLIIYRFGEILIKLIITFLR
jgi:hypothetical protein